MPIEQKQENQRHLIRLAKILSKQAKSGFDYKIDDHYVVLELGGRKHRFRREIVAQMKKKNFISDKHFNLKLTNLGITFLKQTLNPDALLACSQGKLETTSIVLNGDHHQVQVNTSESPLLRLFTRKTKRGNTYISLEEFQAGERLRKDFERGQLQPKITASLQGAVGSTGSSGFAGANDIADFALDARKRVGSAIDTLGPELSGVTLDICCFLKGLEIIERERRWPPRSAKLMLKTALALLARHYGICGYENTALHRINSWGSSDYRPKVGA